MWKGTTYLVTPGGKNFITSNIIHISATPWKVKTSKEWPSFSWGHLSDLKANGCLGHGHFQVFLFELERPGNLATRSTHPHIYPGQTEILTIYSTILFLVNSITLTRSTHLSFGLSQSQACVSNCPHLSKTHSPLSVHTDVQHKGGPGEGFCVGTFKCLIINRRWGGKGKQGKEEREGGKNEIALKNCHHMCTMVA